MFLPFLFLTGCAEKEAEPICYEQPKKSETEETQAPALDEPGIEKTCQDGYVLDDDCHCVKSFWTRVLEGMSRSREFGPKY